MTDTSMSTDPTSTSGEVALSATGLVKRFPLKRNMFGRVTEQLTAVGGVDLELLTGETLGIVGESGSGKTTVGRILAHLTPADEGEISVLGRPLSDSKSDLHWLRRRVQMIFQDPFSSLDPTKTVGHAVREPMVVQKIGNRAEHAERCDVLLDRVGLLPSFRDRYPAELSGGQRQRVSIARALAPAPEILIADEPTSALDLSTRSEILNLLLELQENSNLSIVVISHDFATIRHIAHRVIVMYMGSIVETGSAAEISERPRHPYTKALMSAVPSGDPSEIRRRDRIILNGAHPNPAALPVGCAFQSRCPEVMDLCLTSRPVLESVTPGHWASCHRVESGPVAVDLATA